MLPLLEKEVKDAIEEILRCGSNIDEQADCLFKEADSVTDPQLRASVKDVSREAMVNWGNAADVILDVWNNRDEEVSIEALKGLLQIMENFKKEVEVLRVEIL